MKSIFQQVITGLFIYTLLQFFSFSVQANRNGYIVSYDLTSISKDRLKVKVVTPTITDKVAEYVMPSVIPGSYVRKDFGRFVIKFRAVDHKGKRLKVQRIDANVFRIEKAQNLAHVEYEVNDTWDSQLSNPIFPPGGTNLAARSNVVINHHGYYGYLEGYKMRPYQLKIKKPKEFYGATPLKRITTTSNQDVFEAPNYVKLVDNPILYCKPDTVSFMAANMRVNIAVFSETGVVKAAQIQEIIKPLSDALTDFFGVLPVDDYHFLFYFPEMRFGNEILQQMSFGALEHSYCSFYFLPEYESTDRLTEMVLGVAAHEFLHILTPLTIHSKEIANFDFRNPKMSKHLWLYEGVTEYFSYLVMIRGGLMDAEFFREDWRGKIRQDASYAPVSFTTMSQRIIEPEYQKMYLNVYAKGALIGFLLDIRINELSNGRQNLKSVLLALSKKYGASKPFKDDKLIKEIVSMTHPKIGDFFREYVEGDTPLPYQSYFAKIGWEYLPDANVPIYTYGKPQIEYDHTLKQFYVDKVSANSLGLRAYDRIIAIDKKVLTGENHQKLLVRITDPINDTPVHIAYKRAGKLIETTAKPKVGLEKEKHILRELPNLTAEQRKLRMWLFGNNAFPVE